jgi:glutamyl-tRNA synthetase
MADAMRFYMADGISYDPAAAKKFLTPEMRGPFELIASEIDGLVAFTEQDLEAVFRKVAEDLGVKLGKVAQPVRVALTGGTVSPGLFEVIDVLGKQTVLERLGKALEYIKG